VTSFSEAVAEELRGTAVHVMALCPGFTRTEFHDRGDIHDVDALPARAWSEAGDVVRVALRDLDRRRKVSIPGPHNLVLAAAGHVSPGTWASRLVRIVRERGERIRAR
jgi:short-subunit dehydrogenase